MATFTEIYYNGNEYKQMWLNGSKVWQKLEDGDVPLPSDDQYVGYDLVLYVSGSNTSYGDAFYRATFPNKLDESLEYIDSFTYGAFSGRDYESIAKLKNVKYYGKTETKIDGVGSLSPNYKILKVSAPISATDLSYLCYNISDDTDIRFLRTKNATNMSHMFYDCDATSLDLSAFRTHNVTDMSFMFQYCSSLTSLNLSKFNTSKVTTITAMFYDCSKLISLDLSNFDTSQVTTMANMFDSCSSLTSLDVSNFNTSKVTDMSYFLYHCSSLTSLDLSSFDTSKVTNMNGMFFNCSSLTTLDLSSFDTSNVTDADNMFQYVKNCTIYIGENWTLDTSSSAYGGSNLTFIRVVPITSITLESTLTDTTITKGTQFTITPTITPTDYSGDELVITYDENYLSMVDNTFTVLDTATIGQQLDITYSSKNNPSVNTTYSVTIRDSISITSISLTHTLESLTDVAIGTTFTVVPTVEPIAYDDELLVDYDTNYLSKDGDNYTVLGGASEQTVQVIYYSKHDNNVNAILEFTVEEKSEKEPIVTTYTTFNKVSASEYCSFTTDTEANTVTIKYTYTGSTSYHSNIYTKLDTILPRKCRVRITGESQGTRKYMNVDNVIYPTNSIISLSARGNYNNAWWSTHSMPSDGIVYNNGATQTTSEALDYNEISLYQLNPSQYYLSSSSTNFYPFEYDFTYCFPSEPRLYLNYATHYGGAKGTMYNGTYVTYKDLKIEVYEYPIESIYLTIDDDINNITNTKFTINSTILPSLYSDNDLEIIYDETYMNINAITGEVSLKDGCQGLTHTVTYRSKSDNSINKTITFTVSQDLEIGMDAIDFTQSTAPTLPDCMILDGQGSSYYFKHGTYTTDVYGLVPNNKGVNSSVAYTRYKFVAPKDGALTFTYRCYAETNYDYLTVHVNTSTSQPSYSALDSNVFTTYKVSSYQNTDGTASVNVTGGKTYYIHIQYYKDKSGSNGYDKGCIRKIELL